LEHFLLEGFQSRLPGNFLSVGIMGCQTGFYLAFLNEGRAEKICGLLENILSGVQSAACVPYARIEQCGNYRNHNLELAQQVAREVLARKSAWREVL
ncbi:MAG: S-ribosylhomocysteine lyase, partial [Gammaproteobacteria bacterium]|nr:S-ribosylhomocysteine lyase [Gammaproteobacteria bacterium]MDE1984652.1 S-ribosylhomocysteine lyase [Gammaproteobacteria bacterium]MDE2108442.1 S-ribosylhomocysteine lyase [Gammaproteobacteria bacterium]MDE2460480.1 S-ribosylhomocysteine lyase [Gammaproteobacteria bacterium]